MTVTVPLTVEPEEPAAAGAFVEDAGEQPTARAPPTAVPESARKRRRENPEFVVVMSNLSIRRL
jgi:hypothetical protein